MLETPTIQKVGNNNYAASYGSDKNLYVRFYEDALLNKFQSDESGINVYNQYIMVEIIAPGSKNTQIERIAIWSDEEWCYFKANVGEPSWQQRFPQQWEQFKAQLEQTVEGFPVTECPFFNKAYALNLKSNHIHTLEQIMELPDTNLAALGLGGREIREKVIAFMKKGSDASQITKLFAKIEKLEADNVAMKAQLEDKPIKEKLKLKEAS